MKYKYISNIFLVVASFSLMHGKASESAMTSVGRDTALSMRQGAYSFLNHNLAWSQGSSILYAQSALAAMGLIYPPCFYLACPMLAFTFYFFRNPHRIVEKSDKTTIIAPSDGKVVDIQYNPNGLWGTTYKRKISVFLSPFDVHVNWIPMAGIVNHIEYTTGSFQAAFLPKSSLLNEHNDIEIVSADGKKQILVRQIAGAVARRICCWVEKGQQVDVGDKYGMIRFGSRMDIFLPDNVEIAVSLGERVYGGQTVLSRWTS